MQSNLVDLHMHSNCSDGKLTPSALAEMVSRAGIRAFALTDHDTLQGLQEAEAAAQSLKIEFVPGVEVSASLADREIHILGYYPKNLKLLSQVLDRIRRNRYTRMKKMIDLLIQEGFKIKMEDILQEAGSAAPGRLHLARVLVNKRYVVNIDQAFSLYLGKGKAGYAKRTLLTAEAIIKHLRESGAVTVLAHPKKEGREDPELLINYGLQGIEVYHPDHSEQQVLYYRKLAKKYNLVITGGSDYHGDTNGSKGSLKKQAIDYIYLDILKNAAGAGR
jgi:hypothetical protein